MRLKKRPTAEDGTLPPFIGVMDIAEAGGRVRFKVVGVRKSSSEFSDFVLDLEKEDGSACCLGLKESSNRADSFIDAFGDDTDRWVGQVGTLGLQKSARYGNPTVVVLPGGQAATAVRKAKSKPDVKKRAAADPDVPF